MDTQTLEDMANELSTGFVRDLVPLPVEYQEAEPVEPTDAENLTLTLQTLTLQEKFPGTDGSAWQVGRFLGRTAGFELTYTDTDPVADGFATGAEQGFTDLDLFTFAWAFRTGTWDSDQDRAAAWAAQMLWRDAVCSLEGPRKELIRHHVKELVAWLGTTPYWAKHMVEAY